MPDTPISCSASFTSSSLKGLMIASIFFTCWCPPESSSIRVARHLRVVLARVPRSVPIARTAQLRGSDRRNRSRLPEAQTEPARFLGRGQAQTGGLRKAAHEVEVLDGGTAGALAEM